ncbi:hypothetical protein FRC02_005578 [Tulasnella sp. 418]|nr:hypothetical protein FRC02_005578 [Tulasnella sp. 418]
MPLSRGDQTPSESVNWEPCSPLTSVVSVPAPSSNTSDHSTPIQQLLPLSETSQGSLTLNLQPEPSSADVAESGDDRIDEGNESGLLRIPETWRKPLSFISKHEKITITQRAINFASAFQSSLAHNQASSLESAFALYDRLCGHEGNKLRHIGRSSNIYGLYQDIFSAITGIHGYCAYDNPSLITSSMKIWAIIGDGNDQYWNLVRSNQKYAYREHDRYGYYDQIHLKMQPSGESAMAGGLFAFSSSCNVGSIDSYRTVQFMTLSCYLAECTGVMKYKDTAVLSANCVTKWMLDSATMLIKHCQIDAKTAEEASGAILSSHLTGIAIEGFTVLSRVTGDESWGTLAIDMAVAAMKYEGWHDSNGILTVGCDEDASTNTDVKAFKGKYHTLIQVWDSSRARLLKSLQAC